MDAGGRLPPVQKTEEMPKLPLSIEKRLNEKEAQAKKPSPPPDKEFEGSVKSLSVKHGYGFIVCEEVHRIYGRDVCLPKDVVPDGTDVLDRLRFSLTLSDKGHPQAATVSRTPKI